MIALINQWRLIAGLGLAGGVVLITGWAVLERAERRTLSAQLAVSQHQLEQAAEANATLAATLDRLRADHARQTAVLTAESNRLTARTRQAQTIREGIHNAQAQDDGPVAAVLSDALDRLRRSGAAPDPGIPVGASGPAADAAGLSGKP